MTVMEGWEMFTRNGEKPGVGGGGGVIMKGMRIVGSGVLTPPPHIL